VTNTDLYVLLVPEFRSWEDRSPPLSIRTLVVPVAPTAMFMTGPLIDSSRVDPFMSRDITLQHRL